MTVDFAPQTESEQVVSWNRFMENLDRIAIALCKRGHENLKGAKPPCTTCMKVTVFVSDGWSVLLKEEYERLEVQDEAGIPIPDVSLAEAFFIAATRMEPSWAVRGEGFGPL